MSQIETLRFLSEDQVRQLAKEHGTPLFVYSKKVMKDFADEAKRFETPFGTSILYAMKALPNPEVIKYMYSMGIRIDASSGYEAQEALEAGVKPEDIHITSQETPHNLAEMIKKGVWFNACSLHQLEQYGKLAPGTEVGVRINPGVGDGMNNRLTTGGPAASFGIWHEYIDQVHEIAKRHNLSITLLHTHAGTGTEPEGWLKVATRNIELVREFPDVTTVSLGGGFKIAYMNGDATSNMSEISKPIAELLEDFKTETGREITIEIEPGRMLVANAGALISEVIDTKDTGKNGFEFLVLNSGMTEILRPSMYGAQHPLVTVGEKETSQEVIDYAVSGHCCESGDMFTVEPGDPETLKTRPMNKAEIGDYIVVEVAGAYCAGMRAVGYNSFPVAPEVLID